MSSTVENADVPGLDDVIPWSQLSKNPGFGLLILGYAGSTRATLVGWDVQPPDFALVAFPVCNEGWKHHTIMEGQRYPWTHRQKAATVYAGSQNLEQTSSAIERLENTLPVPHPYELPWSDFNRCPASKHTSSSYTCPQTLSCNSSLSSSPRPPFAPQRQE